MTYSAVDTAAQATRAAGDLLGRVEVALIKKAAVAIAALTDAADQREKGVCQSVLDGSRPGSWVTIVLEVLDIAGALTDPTDTQLDTAVTTAWSYFIKSRS
jgi:hypothetical protein